jgi:hypothetical protein
MNEITDETKGNLKIGDYVVMKVNKPTGYTFVSVRQITEISGYGRIIGKLFGLSKDYVKEMKEYKDMSNIDVYNILAKKFNEDFGTINIETTKPFFIQQYHITEEELKQLDLYTNLDEVKDVLGVKE